jgi:hypothetical protein
LTAAQADFFSSSQYDEQSKGTPSAGNQSRGETFTIAGSFSVLCPGLTSAATSYYDFLGNKTIPKGQQSREREGQKAKDQAAEETKKLGFLT